MRSHREGKAAAARTVQKCLGLSLLTLCLATLGVSEAFAHAVAEGDKGYIQEITGVHLIPFVYLGAKSLTEKEVE